MSLQGGRRLKVLHIIDTLGMGGVETWLMELLRFWRKNPMDAPQIDILSASGNAGLFDEEARGLGANIIYLRYSRSDLLSFIPPFRRLLQHENYNAIHDHQWYTSGWHFLMGSGLLPPVRITHVHNPSFELGNLPYFRSQIAAIGKQLVTLYSTHITGTSRQLITEFGFDAPQFRHIPKLACYCGFSPQRFLGDVVKAKAALCKEFNWSADSKIVLFAGRMDQSADFGHCGNHKNSAFGVDVAIESARRETRLRAIFAGAPSAASSVLNDRIEAAGLGDRIRLVGVRQEIEYLMLGSDVLLFPSRGEGLGMVAVEAQSSGLPVLVSDTVPHECVVIPELVHFKPLSAGITSWADDLLRLIDLPRNAIEANRRVANSVFSIASSAKALTELYRSAAKVNG